MWFFIIIGIVVLGLLMLLKGNDLEESNNNSSTQNLTAADIRTYFPYMDNQTAIKYKDAILNGQYNFEVGKGLIELWKKNQILKKSGPIRTDSTSIPTSEYTKVTWWKLQQYFPIMDSKMSADYLAEHLLDESKWFTVKATVLKEWEKKLAAHKDDENNLHQTATNNNEGIAFEKQGDIASAIEVYENNLRIGYLVSHSYNRLMIIYHREKRYEDEARVIKKAIEVFSSDSRYSKDVTKWQERLNKLTNK
jgi:tetratricopeptide (TPR) repeat protein|nr:MAG TPA: outer envelope protein [Caudoviricetes sp.]